jgi:hypothetical protein
MEPWNWLQDLLSSEFKALSVHTKAIPDKSDEAPTGMLSSIPHIHQSQTPAEVGLTDLPEELLIIIVKDILPGYHY